MESMKNFIMIKRLLIQTDHNLDGTSSMLYSVLAFMQVCRKAPYQPHILTLYILMTLPTLSRAPLDFISTDA